MKFSQWLENRQAHIGHIGTSGIQGHSAGEIFPWVIVIQGYPVGAVYAMKGNRKLTPHVFNGQEEFGTAHELATEDARKEVLNNEQTNCRSLQG